MLVPFILLFLSLGGVAAGLILPAAAGVEPVAAGAAIACVVLLVKAALQRRRAAERWIVLDGSNVMHWKDNTPQIATLREVIAALQARGYAPGVMFDANAGYLLAGRYQHDSALARQLGLPQDRIMVVSKGTPADPAILTAARDLGAAIVTNDRYRDWTDQFPEARDAGHLIRGGYRDGALWLDLPEPQAKRP